MLVDIVEIGEDKGDLTSAELRIQLTKELQDVDTKLHSYLEYCLTSPISTPEGKHDGKVDLSQSKRLDLAKQFILERLNVHREDLKDK